MSLQVVGYNLRFLSYDEMRLFYKSSQDMPQNQIILGLVYVKFSV